MKRFFVLAALVLFSLISLAQNVPKTKVKIALLGTMHLTPSKEDLYKNEGISWSSEKKQKEVEEVVIRLAAFNPDQICIEMPLEKQQKIDSQYVSFLNGTYKLRENEIDLIGFQTAKKAKLKSLTCIKYQGNFDFDPVSSFAQNNDQMNVLEEMDQFVKKFIEEANSFQRNTAFKDNLIHLNSEETLNKNLSIYSRYLVNIGKGNNYTVSKLVSDWYSTNIHIYTNILRAIKPSDKSILVIFGQGHIPILKHLFQSNPDFELVEIEKLLK